MAKLAAFTAEQPITRWHSANQVSAFQQAVWSTTKNSANNCFIHDDYNMLSSRTNDAIFPDVRPHLDREQMFLKIDVVAEGAHDGNGF